MFGTKSLYFAIFIFCFFISYFSGSIAYSGDFSGPYSGTVVVHLMGEQEEEMFFDVLYQSGDSLFLKGAIGCETSNGLVELKRSSDNDFILSKPFSCEILGIEIIVDSMTFAFSNDSFSATMSGGVEDQRFSVRAYGTRIKNITPLQPDVPIYLSGKEDDIKVFALEVPAFTKKIEVATTGGWGDCDLALIYSKPPFHNDLSDDDYSIERVVINQPAAGKWYVVVYGFEDFEGVKLTANIIPEKRTGTPSINLRINDREGFLKLTNKENILISLSINPGGYAGKDADWWLVVQTPAGIEYFDIFNGQFTPGLSCTYQGQLSSFSNVVLPYHNLSGGRYVFYFGIDLIQDGVVNIENLFYDFVTVEVAP